MTKRFITRMTINAIGKYNVHTIAIYLLLKKAYHNGTAYKYNPHSLSKKLNVSEYLLRKYVPIGIKYGFLKEHHGNLTAVSFNFFKLEGGKTNRFVNINVEYDIKSIVFELRSAVMLNNLSQQHHIIQQRSETNFARNRFDKKRYNRIKKLERKYKEKLGMNGKLMLGYRRLSELVGISIGSCRKFLMESIRRQKISGFYIEVERLNVQAEAIPYIKTKGRYIYYSFKETNWLAISPTRITLLANKYV